MLKKDLADDIINAEEKLLKDVGIVAEKKEKRYVSDNARLKFKSFCTRYSGDKGYIRNRSSRNNI